MPLEVDRTEGKFHPKPRVRGSSCIFITEIPMPVSMNPFWLSIRQAPDKLRLHTVDFWERARFALRSDTATVKNRPRLALVGCGWFARLAHLPALRRLENQGLLEIAALCSRSGDSLNQTARQLGRPRIRQSKEMEEILSDSEIDAVDLVLPIPTTPKAIGAGLHAGKHVISEKPCATSVDEGLRLLNFCQNLSTPRIWAVGENWRFKTSVSRIEKIVRGGDIGEPQLVQFRKLFFFPPEINQSWRSQPNYQGGHLLDVGVHFAALLRKVIGEVEEVRAVANQRQSHLPPADTLQALLNFENGVEGSFVLSVAAQELDKKQPDLSVVGSRGTVHAHFMAGYIQLFRRSGKKTYYFPNDPWNEGGVYGSLKHFVKLLSSTETVPTENSPQEGLRDIALIEAMLISSNQGIAVRPRKIFS